MLVCKNVYVIMASISLLVRIDLPSQAQQEMIYRVKSLSNDGPMQW